MAVKVVIEKVFENMEEATIGKWLKREGDYVNEGEPLVEIITEKVTFEMESPSSGILRRIVAPEKSTVPVGYIIALLGEENELLPDVDTENEHLLRQWRGEQLTVEHVSAAATKVQHDKETAQLRGAEKVRATPAAKRLAREHGISIDEVANALGVEVVSEGDVRRYLEGRS
ncbi:MAG: biotin/lipoyl-containing protein [Armatimonadota bacterium]|nr:E3 binding domain-containing protein [Armatimonadota bacterium]MCX7776643.1 E3 binding domain-containing protein [Armatimonadota bacterium]MDW8025213.1 biotin/lipoyl-containing protein [Armatimonadota bacterium]